jgi:signal transduction histidine kinase/ActR/RegA family two-component response regulator
MLEENRPDPLEARKEEEKTRWPVQWTNRLQRLAAGLSTIVDPASMARQAVEQAQAALRADAGIVLLLTDDGASLECAHATGHDPRALAGWRRVPLSAHVPATDALRTGEPVVLRSRDEMRAKYPDVAELSSGLVHTSWAIVPLVAESVCIGVLGLSFLDAQTFAADEVAFLRVVANQCAQALQRATLSERERRSTTRLRVLAEASRALAAVSPDVRSVLNAMGPEVLTHVGDSCSIALASADREWLEVAVIHDRDPERERHLREVAGSLRMRRGEGISGKVLESGQSALLAVISPREMAERSAPFVSGRIEALAVRSLLAVPIKTRGRTVGTITTSRYDEGNPFTEDDRALLEDLADRAALAIENARLHEFERHARTRAEEADHRKDEFLAMLGHELRNPLAPIWTALEIMRQQPPRDDGETWARAAIERQVAQLSRLVDDLLDVSRINLGKIDLRLEAVDLGTVALQALEASRPLLTERRHKILVDLPPAPVRVRGDAVRLMQIIANLLNNAAKYTDPGGEVRLRVATAGVDAIVAVSDTGMGIPPDMIGHVFDLFAQVREARDRSMGGLGIGLTLVKRLVEMHGGYVRATSAGANRGSEFVLGFPALAHAPAAERAAAAEVIRGGRTRRVLIADDNVDAADGLRRLLEFQRHQVEVVHDGLAAVEAARSEPDIVLLDISLPGLDGLEVARRIRARPGTHRPLLVAVTGLGRDEDRRRSEDAGFDHHLVKPIDLASLTALLAADPRALVT